MRMLRPTLCLALAAGLAACDLADESPTGLGPTLDPDGAPLAAAPATRVTASASGAAIRYAGDTQVLTNFAVHERDGEAEGFFHYRAGAAELRVDVTCMTVVDGHKAWIAGVIEESTVGFIGHVSYFYTYDNGEGADAPPDIVSRLRVEATPGLGEDQRFCDELPTILTALEVEQGNVNVRG